MLPWLKDKLRSVHADEEGATLLSSVVATTFVFIIVAALGSTMLSSVTNMKITRTAFEITNELEGDSDEILAAVTSGKCIAAGSTESGNSYKVFTTPSETAPLDKSSEGVKHACPVATDNFFIIEIVLKDGDQERRLESVYSWVSAGTGSSFIPGAFGAPQGTKIEGVTMTAHPSSPLPADLRYITANGHSCSYVSQGGVLVVSANLIILDLCLSLAGDALLQLGLGAGTQIVTENLEASAFDSWVKYNPQTPVAVDSRFCTNAKTWGLGGFLGLGGSSVRGWAVDYLEGLTTPTVVNATGCSTVQLKDISGNLKLKSDVTVISSAFDMANLRVEGPVGKQVKFNLIVPDRGAANLTTATCANASLQSQSKLVNVSLMAGVYGLLYSPCSASLSGVHWTGQIHTGAIYMDSSKTQVNPTGSLVFRPVPLEGMPVTSTSNTIMNFTPVLMAQYER